MSATNQKRTKQFKELSNHEKLERLVMSCLLWENNFYIDGKSVTDIIKELVPKCETQFLVETAIKAKEDMKLRHVPLFIVREMARYNQHKSAVRLVLPEVITRPDDLTEFVSLYWKDGKEFLSNPVKKGLAEAFSKFDEYSLAKYNRKDKSVTLKDVAFLCHVKPWDGTVSSTIKERNYKNSKDTHFLPRSKDSTLSKLINDELATPNTWEVRLSSGEDKNKVFTELMKENKLGALAFLRNLRNMSDANVDRNIIVEYSKNLNVSKMLPFQFITAARMNPWAETFLEPMMLKCLEGKEKLKGKTLLMIDVSGSMDTQLSAKGTMTRLDVAYGLGSLCRELCEDAVIYTFSTHEKLVPSRRGFGLVDAIKNSQMNGGTYFSKSLNNIKTLESNTIFDRTIVLTDEQFNGYNEGNTKPEGEGWMINIGISKNSVEKSDNWNRINGWSENVFSYILNSEK